MVSEQGMQFILNRSRLTGESHSDASGMQRPPEA